MTTHPPYSSDRFGTGLRWAARLLATAVVALAVLFLVGMGGFNPMQMNLQEAVLMVLFWTAILGLLVGWRWEGVGGALTVGSLFLFYLVEWLSKGRFPGGWAFGVIALPGLLFLCCAAWKKGHPHQPGAWGGQHS
jgi:hypothetical protein